ncbi:MAG: hypothetical protein ACI8WB_005386 [Phenylobacterium sp.]|jgi:hypothetical protein
MTALKKVQELKMKPELKKPPNAWLFKKPSIDIQATIPMLDIEAMERIMYLVSENDPRDSDLTAGMTYFGQMIAHDIVPASREGSDVRAFVEESSISSNLDLASIYGNTNFQKDDAYFSKHGKFFFGRAKQAAYGTDLLRNEKEVCIPDIRNDGNVITAQLHLFWQKLHNKVIDSYFNGHVDRGSDQFQLVRHFVTAVFHRIVVDEFLFQLLHPTIYQVYCLERQLFLLKGHSMTDIPREFSHAAFRMGHSMVRSHYRLQQGADVVKLMDLFIRPNLHHEAIEPEHVIDWYLFFGRVTKGYANSQNASRIDLKISEFMRNIPVAGFNGLNMIEANLEAGEQAELLPGNWFVEQIMADVPLAKATAMEDHPIANYKASPLKGLEGPFPVKQLPLWAYVLIENDTSQNIDWEQKGHTAAHMGKVGSIIIAEVLMKSIGQVVIDEAVQPLLDRFYYRLGHSQGHNKANKQTSDGSRLSMLDLIHFVNE